MKALDTYHMIPLEIFRTYPDAYFLANAEWHEIRGTVCITLTWWLPNDVNFNFVSKDSIFSRIPNNVDILLFGESIYIASRRNGTWTLSLDDIVRGQLVTGQNNVQLRDHPVYIGGKPGMR